MKSQALLLIKISNFKFEIAQIIDNQAQIVNAWYDNENTNIEDYKVILDTGMVLM